MTAPSKITFDAACDALCAADRVYIGETAFKVVSRPELFFHALILEAVGDPRGPRVHWFTEEYNRAVEATLGALHMVNGDGKKVMLHPTASVCDGSRMRLASTAAAIMDAMHSEVVRQSEGSESAYQELYEVATKMEIGFVGIWGWVALLADTSVIVEGHLERGDIDFIDTIHAVAQEFHNHITTPGSAAVTRSQAEAMWEAAAQSVRDKGAEITAGSGGRD